MTEELTLETGLKIICMDKEYISGLMEEHMKVNISMIRNMGMVFIHIPTKDPIKGCGPTENNTEKEHLSHHWDTKEKEFGKKVRE